MRLRSRITAAATTGPASGPRPASSTPQIGPAMVFKQARFVDVMRHGTWLEQGGWPAKTPPSPELLMTGRISHFFRPRVTFRQANLVLSFTGMLPRERNLR